MLRIMSTVITMILTKVTVISSVGTERKHWGELKPGTFYEPVPALSTTLSRF